MLARVVGVVGRLVGWPEGKTKGAKGREKAKKRRAREEGGGGIGGGSGEAIRGRVPRSQG